MSRLSDPSAERAVLAGIYRHGVEAYYDVADILNDMTFTIPSNSLLYSCFKQIIDKDRSNKIDVASILSAAKDLGFPDFYNKNDEMSHLSAICKFPILKENTRKFAAKIRKLQIARMMYEQLENTRDQYLHIKGDESIAHILGIAEQSIFDFTTLLNDDKTEGPKKIYTIAKEFLEEKAANIVDQVGIPTGYPKYDFSIGGGLRKGTVNMIGARPKALAYGSKVYTPNGPINIEDIKVGDTVVHPFNGETIVTHVWDHKNIDIYRMHFRDGDYVDCCEDHLWHVYKRYPYNNNKQYLKTTKELIGDLRLGKKQEYKWDIPLPNPTEYTAKKVPIDPYVLGVLLGDGSVANGTCSYHTADDEVHSYMVNYFNKIGLEVKFESQKSKCITWRVNGFQDKLREVGIFGHNCYNKFIPKNYIYNSQAVRMSILAGLLDTDGDCTIDNKSNQSRIRFASVSHQLCLDVKEIVHSLGGLCSINPTTTKANGKSFNSYRCEIRLPFGTNPFVLSRKANNFTNRKIGKLKRTIVKIEKITKANARCLTLKNDDGLFMTDNYVVTHNTGKSLLSLNMGDYIATKGIPVLYLDTEMMDTDQLTRALAMKAYGDKNKVTINEIETGKFARGLDKKEKLMRMADRIKDIPFYHANIGGMPFEEQLSTMRRWVAKDVGMNDQGHAKDCVIIYDYLKLMDIADMKNANLSEFQLLGFMMTSLHNFAVRYRVPILSFIQLNRDGITKESTDTASGSDRIIWLCSNFSIYKEKSPEEIAKDGEENGMRKLVPLIARHGAGLEHNDYINFIMHGQHAKLIEGKTALELNDGGSYTEDEKPTKKEKEYAGKDEEDVPF